MVNNSVNVSAYQGEPPTSTGEQRVYLPGPIYPVEDVLRILSQGDEQTRLWTRACIRDVTNMAFELAEVRELVRLAIIDGVYANSQWCIQKPNGPWAACDSYRLSRQEWIDSANKMMSLEYYVKYAISKTGKILLLVSCHMSQ